jgi:hypothetical protein
LLGRKEKPGVPGLPQSPPASIICTNSLKFIECIYTCGMAFARKQRFIVRSSIW